MWQWVESDTSVIVIESETTGCVTVMMSDNGGMGDTGLTVMESHYM